MFFLKKSSPLDFDAPLIYGEFELVFPASFSQVKPQNHHFREPYVSRTVDEIGEIGKEKEKWRREGNHPSLSSFNED